MRFAARLLLIVALLLPFRGAMAVAGGWCHGPERGLASATAVATEAHFGHGHGEHRAHAAHAHRHADVPAPDVTDAAPFEPDAALSSSCTFCTAVCAAPPLPSGTIGIHALLPTGAERFPPLSPPRSSVAFGALERPPRTA